MIENVKAMGMVYLDVRLYQLVNSINEYWLKSFGVFMPRFVKKTKQQNNNKNTNKKKKSQNCFLSFYTFLFYTLCHNARILSLHKSSVHT